MTKTNYRQKYHFDDFTESAYRECLKIAKNQYEFVDFLNFKKEARICLWRHDIDTSPHRGLSLARIEFQEDVKSTYFFHFHSDRYNAFDKEIRTIMSEILHLGHDIGLHFDPKYYSDEILSNSDIEKYLQYEKDILSNIINRDVHAFSFHNPSTNNLLDINQETFCGITNAYNRYIKENFEYCSDSFCYWRFRRLIDVLNDTTIQKLHILTHPVCWTPTALSPYARFLRAARGRSKKTIQTYRQNAKKNNRKIIR